MTELDYGDIVRLRHDPNEDNLREGDCGIIWCIDNRPPLTHYEASFINRHEQDVDLVFTQDEVELLQDFEETPFPEPMRRLQRILTRSAS